MPWTCPGCGKTFKNTNQWHSCARLDLEDHLRGKSSGVRAIVERLIEGARDFGPIFVNPVKTSIQLKSGATFLSIRTKKDHVEVEFQSARESSAFPIYKSVRVSRNRVVHMAIIEDAGDVDARLLGRIRESYELTR